MYMAKLVELSRSWILDIVIGNDWSEPIYIETKEFKTKEELLDALQSLDYYSYIERISEVIEYKI